MFLKHFNRDVTDFENRVETNKGPVQVWTLRGGVQKSVTENNHTCASGTPLSIIFTAN